MFITAFDNASNSLFLCLFANKVIVVETVFVCFFIVFVVFLVMFVLGLVKDAGLSPVPSYLSMKRALSCLLITFVFICSLLVEEKLRSFASFW